MTNLSIEEQLDKLKQAKVKQLYKSIKFFKKATYTEDQEHKLRDDKLWGTIDPTEETNYLHFKNTLKTCCTTIEDMINNSTTIPEANTIDTTAELLKLGLTF